MGHPVKISDDLALDARLTAEAARRSIAGQIEFWAHLGRAIDPLLQGSQVLALQKSGKTKSLSACLDSVDTPVGRHRVADYLTSRPFPHYEPAPGRPGMLVRTEADGSRTVGRFVRRRFTPVE